MPLFGKHTLLAHSERSEKVVGETGRGGKRRRNREKEEGKGEEGRGESHQMKALSLCEDCSYQTRDLEAQKS